MTKVLFKPQSSNDTVTTKRQCVPSIVSGHHQHDFRCLTAHYQPPTFFSESKALCVDLHSVFEFSVPYRCTYIFTALLASHQKKSHPISGSIICKSIILPNKRRVQGRKKNGEKSGRPYLWLYPSPSRLIGATVFIKGSQG